MPKKQTKPKKPAVRRGAKKSPTRSRVRKIYQPIVEADSTYLLKLVVVVILGTFWLKFHAPLQWGGVHISALPVGVIAGLLLVKLYEKYQADRKIWYAVLLVVGIVSYFVPAGIVL
jgi:hypothetical protein